MANETNKSYRAADTVMTPNGWGTCHGIKDGKVLVVLAGDCKVRRYDFTELSPYTLS